MAETNNGIKVIDTQALIDASNALMPNSSVRQGLEDVGSVAMGVYQDVKEGLQTGGARAKAGVAAAAVTGGVNFMSGVAWGQEPGTAQSIVVVRGNTTSGLAQKNDKTVEEIQFDNQLKDAGLIFENQVLKICLPGERMARYGETNSGEAVKQRMTLAQYMALNADRITDPNSRIAGKCYVEAPSLASMPTAVVENHRHTMGKGEAAWGVVKEECPENDVNAALDATVKANNLIMETRRGQPFILLHPGQVLDIVCTPPPEAAPQPPNPAPQAVSDTPIATPVTELAPTAASQPAPIEVPTPAHAEQEVDPLEGVNLEAVQPVHGTDPAIIKSALERLIAVHGFPVKGAAWFTGNTLQESGNDPNAVGDGGQGIGVVQWHPSRRSDDFPYGDYIGQIDYAVAEMQASYPKAYAIYMDPNATDAELSLAAKTYEGYDIKGRRDEYGQQLHEQLLTPKPVKEPAAPVPLPEPTPPPADPAPAPPELTVQQLTEEVLNNPNITISGGRVRQSVEDILDDGATFTHDTSHDNVDEVPVNPKLMTVLESIATQSEVTLTSLTTGKHTDGSDHYKGKGEDVATPDMPTTAKYLFDHREELEIDKLIFKNMPEGTYTLRGGEAYKYNDETMAAHDDHIHISVNG